VTPRTPRRTFALAAVLVLVASACATTRQTRGVEPAGFLGDYSQLRPGVGAEAQLIYIDEDASWSKYDAIILDSVTIWHGEGTQDLSPEDQQRLTDLLYAKLHEQLSQDYHMVAHPGPTTLRVRAAITEAKGARVVGNAITTIVPQARTISTLTGLASNTQVWVGKAAVEGEITDSMTGARLSAAVDERAGGKTLRGIGGKWKDVENAFDEWARRLRDRLRMLRED
jgi:hypothetical protein